MHLKSFKAESYINGKLIWKFDRINFSSFNLIVGKNSSGKTRLLSLLEKYAELFLNKAKIDEIGMGSINADFVFSTSTSEDLIYEISTFNDGDKTIILKEFIAIKEEILLDRKNNLTLISDKSENNDGEKRHIYPPEDEIVLSVRRDNVYFPFLDVLYEWASNFKFFRFGHFHTYAPNFIPYSSIDFENAGILYDDFDRRTKRNVLENVKKMGFEITEITTISIPQMESNKKFKLFRLKEKGVSIPIVHIDISQGLYRTITILVYLEYLSKLNTGTIAIDDLAEGLDFHRANILVKLIFEKFKTANIQIILSSNDSHVLDNVDLSYWKILDRVGSSVKVFDYNNSDKIFEEFKQIGLNNFDFLTSDFINRKNG